MAGKLSVSISLLLLLVIAAYFIILGVQGINTYNSKTSQLIRNFNEIFGKSGSPVTLIIAIAELAAGVALILSLILPGLSTTLQMSAIIVWVAKIAYTSFMVRISTSGDSISFRPDFIGWLALLLVDVIILLALFSINRNRA